MSDANKYTGRLAGHYVDLERFVQAIYESTQPFAELRSAAETLPLEFDIDTAVGVQLDAVGERVGVSRKLKTPLEGVYFAFDEDEVGFDEGVWKDDYDPSEGMVSLDDEFYRLVIKAKIAANSIVKSVSLDIIPIYAQTVATAFLSRYVGFQKGLQHLL